MPARAVGVARGRAWTRVDALEDVRLPLPAHHSVHVTSHWRARWRWQESATAGIGRRMAYGDRDKADISLRIRVASAGSP
ncbi:MAG: hypothetical protein ACYC3L_00320 [Gemmatimonadaceae bacterium]